MSRAGRKPPAVLLLAAAALMIAVGSGETLGQEKVEQLVAVVHASRTEQTSVTDLKNIYLGRRKSWSNGTPIRPYMRPPSTPAGLAFHRLLKMTPARFRFHWHALQLSGQGTMPRTLTSATEVVATVAVQPGAIGYLTRSEADRTPHGSQVKVLPIW